MRGRADGVKKKQLVTSLCVVGVFLVFIFVYYGSSSGSGQGASAMEYGRTLRKLGSSYLGGDDDAELSGKQDESLTRFGQEEGDDNFFPKSFPVSFLAVSI